ncbi:hypothetical protein M9458_001732, partial [Cirrhinus mrigala]
VQWSHLAALKSSSSAPPVDPVPGFAHLHLRSQDSSHQHHPVHPSYPDHPQPPSQSRGHEAPEQTLDEEVPPR